MTSGTSPETKKILEFRAGKNSAGEWIYRSTSLVDVVHPIRLSNFTTTSTARTRTLVASSRSWKDHAKCSRTLRTLLSIHFEWLQCNKTSIFHPRKGNRSKEGLRCNSNHYLYSSRLLIIFQQILLANLKAASVSELLFIMSTRGWVMTPEEKAAALAEAKTRGLPDGWRVELDVSLFSFVNMHACFVKYIQAQDSL